MDRTAYEQLIAYNQLHKEMDVAYHNYARSIGLSDTAFWILYSVSEHSGMLTQRELCVEWSYAPQTVNSALKELEKQGLIALQLVPGSRKNKQILLTEAGEGLTLQSIKPLMEAEAAAFSALGSHDTAVLLSATEKHVSILRDEIGKLQLRQNNIGSSEGFPS